MRGWRSLYEPLLMMPVVELKVKREIIGEKREGKYHSSGENLFFQVGTSKESQSGKEFNHRGVFVLIWESVVVKSGCPTDMRNAQWAGLRYHKRS